MKFGLLITIFLLSGSLLSFAQNRYTLSGSITDENGEVMIGVNVYNTTTLAGSSSNAYGFYSISLPPGEHEITFSLLGYQTYSTKLNFINNIKLNISLKPEVEELDEIFIHARKKDANVNDIKMSYISLPVSTIKRIPVLMGETDIIKSIQLLPGVQTSVEGSSGFYVRGGNADQNLILLDEATVYNPSHLFGFFSVFNGDAIKNVELHKGGIPANFGGRLSSVLDIRMKDGNTQKIKGEGGIGMISSRLTLKGPIIKDKISFIVSGRRTYADLFLPLAKDSMARKSTLYFYDLNAKINYKISDKDRIFVSGYFGRDVNKLGDMFQFNFGNATATVRWNHIYNGKLFSNATILFSDFDYNLGTPEGVDAFKWLSHIIDYSFAHDYTYYINPGNTLTFGIHSTFHTIKPGVIESTDENSFINELKYPNAYAIESAVFLSNEQKINSKLSLLYGIRYSLFQNIGKATVYSYTATDGGKYNVSDTAYYKQGDIFKHCGGLEPRLGARYSIDEKNSVKVSYNRMNQYLHLASNSTASFPMDMWFMSGPNVKPQKVDQVALGYFRNFKNNAIETSAEIFYKKFYNTIDFRDHAVLLPNEFLEGELRIGSAKAYGIEFMVRKNEGKINGWVSYTYSRAIRKIPEINNGKAYPASYDKPNNISVVLNYDVAKQFTLSANWVYSSAIPVTVPVGGYYYQNLWIPEYTDRNAVRIKGTSYHRLDLSATYHFKTFGLESNLNLSIYNLYNRHNAFAINFRDKNATFNPSTTSDKAVEVVKLYLFPIIPAFTYNIKF